MELTPALAMTSTNLQYVITKNDKAEINTFYYRLASVVGDSA